MKSEKYRSMSVDKLQQEVLQLYRESFNIRMQKGSGQLTRSSQIISVRRNIARIKTIMNEKTKMVHKQ